MSASAKTELARGRFRWVYRPFDAVEAASFASSLGIGPVASRVLYARGLRDSAAARRFLNPALEDLHDPLTMRGMPQAVARLRLAIASKEKILIYGDYDVDGATSVVALRKAIELAGGVALFHVPDRFKEGYGMRSEVVERAGAEGVT